MRTIALVAIALAGMSLNTKTQSSRWQRLADIQRCIACSLSAFLPPSPPAEKATAREDQARQSGTGDGTGHGQEAANLATRERCAVDV